MTDFPIRTRTITWEDPMIGAQAARSLSGLEYLQGIIDGKYPVPPMATLMDLSLVEVGDGRAVFTCVPGDHHYNNIGVAHGGLVSTMLDSALGCAVQTKLPVGVGYTTIELHVNFLRALTVETGLVRCEGEVLHSGRSIATAQARLTDEAGKLYAHGTTTCMIFRPE
jgi:uncharacterized protein (TIGR00369 family)